MLFPLVSKGWDLALGLPNFPFLNLSSTSIAFLKQIESTSVSVKYLTFLMFFKREKTTKWAAKQTTPSPFY